MIFKKKYTISDGIVTFDINDSVTKKVVEFYKKAPFPNYTELDNKSSINFKGEKNYLTREFKKYVGFGKNILEVGCGTGQLSLYLAIGTNNKIFALDPALASINLGKDFSKRNNILNITFVNADIFDDVFEDKFFDFIWSNGVLHHTKNASKGFDIIIKYLKKNGYIILGLYNKYGRLRTLFRRFLYKIFGNFVIKYLDPNLRKNIIADDKQKKAWIRDQYEHPVESLHTLDEVLAWFKKNNIEFINSIPSCDLKNNLGAGGQEALFNKTSVGTFFSRILSQIFMLFNNFGSDGGLFIVIGKKK
jgi:SAM-dependent methyltransferase